MKWKNQSLNEKLNINAKGLEFNHPSMIVKEIGSMSRYAEHYNSCQLFKKLGRTQNAYLIIWQSNV